MFQVVQKKIKKMPISVVLKLDSYSDVFDTRLSNKVVDLLRVFQTKQLSNYYIKISFFTHNGQLYSIRYLNQFFKYLSLGYKPIAELNSSFDGIFFKKKHQRRKVLAKTIEPLVEVLYRKKLGAGTIKNSLFFSNLKKVVKKINSKEWFLIEIKLIESILNSPEWNTIYNNSDTFSIALDINAALESYKAVLSYLIKSH